MVLLETERLLLRNYKEEDFSDIMEYFSNEEVSRYEDFYPMSENQVKKIIAEWKNMDNRFVAELKECHKVVGSVGYWIDEDGHHCIDYDFNPEFGGNGYATEACEALLHYLFHTKEISEVYGDCDVRNEASWKLLERLGFERMQKLDNQSYKNDANGQPIIIQTYLYRCKNDTLQADSIWKYRVMDIACAHKVAWLFQKNESEK